jgi:hypothetical protein
MGERNFYSYWLLALLLPLHSHLVTGPGACRLNSVSTWHSRLAGLIAAVLVWRVVRGRRETAGSPPPRSLP